MKAGWYDAPKQAAKHEPGTLVAEPAIKNGCWGTTSRGDYVGAYAGPRSCSLRARRGCLTCIAHRRLEGDAKALKTEFEQQAQGAAE